MANTKASTVYGVNENGEVVATSGTGSTNVTGFLPLNELPVDDNGKLVIAGLGNGGGGSGLPTVSSMVTISTATAAPSTTGNFTAFPSQLCTELHITNRTGVEIEYVRNGGANFISIRPGVTRRIVGITNANQISVRRSDWDDTAVAAVVASNSTTNPLYLRSSAVSAIAVTSTESFAVAGVLNAVMTNGGGGDDLPALACTGIEIINNTGKDLNYRTSGATSYARLYSGASVIIVGITNANQIHIQPFDSVIDSGARPVMVEAFTSGLRERLNNTQPALMLSADATVMGGDMQVPSKMPTGPNLKLGELARGPRRTLAPKRVYPLAQFTTQSAMSGTGQANSSDVGDGDIVMGSTHIEWTAPAANTYNFAAAATANATPIDVTGGVIRFTVSFPGGTPNFNTTGALNSLRVQLHSTGSPTSPSANYNQVSLIPQAFLTVSERKRVFSFSIPVNVFQQAANVIGTGATLTAVTWARFQLSTGSAGNGAKFRPISIEFVPSALTKAIVILSNDDFHSGVWTGMLPSMAKYGYPGVMFADAVTALGQGTGLTIEQVRILHQHYGWQVANQNYGGETNYPESIEHVLQEHSKFNVVMRELGIELLEDSSYGSSSTTNFRDDNLPAMKRMYRSGVLFNNGSNTTPPMSAGETAPFGDPYRIKRLNMSGYTAGTFIDRWKDHVQQAVDCKGVAIFGCHGELNAGSIAPGVEVLNSFPAFIEYLRGREIAGEIEVLTLAQAIEKIYPR